MMHRNDISNVSRKELTARRHASENTSPNLKIQQLIIGTSLKCQEKRIMHRRYRKLCKDSDKAKGIRMGKHHKW